MGLHRQQEAPAHPLPVGRARYGPSPGPLPVLNPELQDCTAPGRPGGHCRAPRPGNPAQAAFLTGQAEAQSWCLLVYFLGTPNSCCRARLRSPLWVLGCRRLLSQAHRSGLGQNGSQVPASESRLVAKVSGDSLHRLGTQTPGHPPMPAMGESVLVTRRACRQPADAARRLHCGIHGMLRAGCWALRHSQLHVQAVLPVVRAPTDHHWSRPSLSETASSWAGRIGLRLRVGQSSRCGVQDGKGQGFLSPPPPPGSSPCTPILNC